MEWETDRSLQLRMVLTLVVIALLPMAFTVTMTAAFNHVIFPLAESMTDAQLGTVQVNPVVVLALTLAGMVLACVTGERMALDATNARVVEEEDAPELHARVKRLAATADVPPPEVAIAESSAPNAFATGRSREHSTVVVVTITISVAFWAASSVLFRLISQYREYAADRGGAAITGDPLALASALETIDRRLSTLPDRDLRELDGGVEALYIAPLELPLFNDEDDDTLLSHELFPNSHPPTRERVERLRELAGDLET